MTAVLSEHHPLSLVLVKPPGAAFVDEGRIAREWRKLGFTSAPDLARARDEHARFVALLEGAGATVVALPEAAGTTLDSIYARDAGIVSPRGVVLSRMGKAARRGEPEAQRRVLEGLGIAVLGAIDAPGTLEGGDVVWLDDRTLIVGRGYRTNAEGIRQLRVLVGDAVDVVEVPLPHWRGEGDVMHLMSLMSPVDEDLAVVHSPLLPVPFREWLLARGVRFVEVPAGEFDTMGTNVLALAPRRCVMLAGNPRTRDALLAAGAHVVEYEGTEISMKGAGGPTCLTRPLLRLA